jgi:hypothetical protein
MGDAMNPLSPNQILRNLEHGYFMTHQEQSEAAQYIRQLQQAVLDEREVLRTVSTTPDGGTIAERVKVKILQQQFASVVTPDTFEWRDVPLEVL